MSEALKASLRRRCVGGKHVDEPFPPSDGYCFNCSRDHVEEFGDCVGIVQGPVDYNNVPPDHPEYDPRSVGPEVDVRWQPSNLRYGYHPDELELI